MVKYLCIFIFLIFSCFIGDMFYSNILYNFIAKLIKYYIRRYEIKYKILTNKRFKEKIVASKYNLFNIKPKHKQIKVIFTESDFNTKQRILEYILINIFDLNARNYKNSKIIFNNKEDILVYAKKCFLNSRSDNLKLLDYIEILIKCEKLFNDDNLIKFLCKNCSESIYKSNKNVVRSYEKFNIINEQYFNQYEL